MPLFHSIACSLQLAAHAQTHKNPESRTEQMHARMNASVFSVTSCPDMSLKSVTGSGGVISAALCLRMGKRDRSRGVCVSRGGAGAELCMNPNFTCGIKQEFSFFFHSQIGHKCATGRKKEK